MALQERNVRFAQGLVDDSIKELRSQVESNRAMTQEFVERTQRQREAFQSLLEESVDAYVDLLYTPLAYYRRGPRLLESEVGGGGFPIPNHDELNVEELKGDARRSHRCAAPRDPRLREAEQRSGTRIARP